MNLIETTLPIPLPLLEEYFKEDNSVFIVDYENSRLKDSSAILYIGNIDVKARFNIPDVESGKALLLAYLKSTSLVYIPELIDSVVQLLLAVKNLPHDLSFDPTEFIEENKDIIQEWIQRVDSLQLFAKYSYQILKTDEHKKYPVNNVSSPVACNFVFIIQHPLFPILLEAAEEKNIRFYPKLFNEYLFKGKNLFHFWASENNPFYVMSCLPLAEDFDSKELCKLINNAVDNIKA